MPGPEPFHAIPLLDAGVQGIIVPHVDTAEEARALVDAFRFPPIGRRSLSRTSASAGFESLPIGEFAAGVNEELLIVPMLETPRAIENADEIAAVEGIDVLLIGASDLCAELNLYDAFDDMLIQDAFRSVGAACRKHGKTMGMGGIRGDELMSLYLGFGVRFVIAGTDVPLLIGAGRRLTRRIRQIGSAGADK